MFRVIISLLLLLKLVTGQYFVGCDYFQQLRVGVNYQIYSPGFQQGLLYPRGTRCRWTAVAPPGFQVNINCDHFDIPTSLRCSGDAFIVSRLGRHDLRDGERYCGTGRVSFQSHSVDMVVSLQALSTSRGGRLRCFFSAIPNPCTCGMRNRGRIVGGTETLANEYPMMAGIVDTLTRNIVCGATIISETHAISAAHCNTGRTLSRMTLLVGEHNITTGNDTPHAALYTLRQFLRHPAYRATTGANDIALLQTTTRMIFNRGVQPVCLPFKFRGRSFVGNTVIAAGWGHDDFGGRPSTVLMHVFLNVVSSTRCTATQMCTFTPGRDTCQNDSGGPLFYQDTNGLLYSVGIISEGVGCNAGFPGINTRVTEYLDWIQQNTASTVYCVR
jgi:hypothetical protein